VERLRWPRRESRLHLLQVMILGGYLLLALTFGVINPAFESPDELHHFDYVEELLRTRRLPVAEGEMSEFHQPPLYYLAGAVLTAWIPVDRPVAEVVERNPYWAWRIGEVGVDNKSQYLHGPEENFPYQGRWLRLHLLRLFSTLLGLGVVWYTGRLLLFIWPQRHEQALLAMAAVAFLPQFLFISSSVTNDIATTLIGTLILIGLARFYLLPEKRVLNSLLLALLLGCGLLAKMNMLVAWGVIGMSIVAYLVVIERRWSFANLAIVSTILGGPLVVAGPYLWRNWQVYGDPTALSRMDELWGRWDPPLPLSAAIEQLPYVWTSFWGRFGYGQIPLSDNLYLFFFLITLPALAGYLWSASGQIRLLRSRLISTRLWLFYTIMAMFLAYFAAILRFSQTALTGSQGRFFFPVLSGIALLMAIGLHLMTQRLKLSQLYTVGAYTFVLCAVNIWILVVVLYPAYVLPVTELAATDAMRSQASWQVGDVALLHSAVIVEPILQPGRDAIVELTWQPLMTTTIPLSGFIHLIGPNDEMVGGRDSYPGMGRTSTTFWRPGSVFVDRYRIPIKSVVAEEIAPARVRVAVGLYNLSTMERLPLYHAGTDTALTPPVVSEAKLPPRPDPSRTLSAQQPRAKIGGALDLYHIHLSDQLAIERAIDIDLIWKVVQPLHCNCKLFIHLVQDLQHPLPLSQADDYILQNRFPGYMWAAGEVLYDSHRLHLAQELAPGEYHLIAGIYDAESGSRLAVEDPLSQDAHYLYLGAVTVTR
jgi:4-amino-4-deoxy-L-arabinose transferase-like glycosyltransferase